MEFYMFREPIWDRKIVKVVKQRKKIIQAVANN